MMVAQGIKDFKTTAEVVNEKRGGDGFKWAYWMWGRN
jgi:hypothetical protein